MVRRHDVGQHLIIREKFPREIFTLRFMVISALRTANIAADRTMSCRTYVYDDIYIERPGSTWYFQLAPSSEQKG